LQNTVAKKWDVEVMTGKANLEVRPKFVNKGEIARRLVLEYGDKPEQRPEFVLCLGDDFTDEGELIRITRSVSNRHDVSDASADMFRSLRQSKLPEEHVFSVTVGASSKQTLASWHLLEPADVIAALALLNGSTDTSNIGPVAVVEGTVPDAARL